MNILRDLLSAEFIAELTGYLQEIRNNNKSKPRLQQTAEICQTIILDYGSRNVAWFGMSMLWPPNKSRAQAQVGKLFENLYLMLLEANGNEITEATEKSIHSLIKRAFKINSPLLANFSDFMYSSKKKAERDKLKSKVKSHATNLPRQEQELLDEFLGMLEKEQLLKKVEGKYKFKQFQSKVAIAIIKTISGIDLQKKINAIIREKSPSDIGGIGDEVIQILNAWPRATNVLLNYFYKLPADDLHKLMTEDPNLLVRIYDLHDSPIQRSPMGQILNNLLNPQTEKEEKNFGVQAYQILSDILQHPNQYVMKDMLNTYISAMQSNFGQFELYHIDTQPKFDYLVSSLLDRAGSESPDAVLFALLNIVKACYEQDPESNLRLKALVEKQEVLFELINQRLMDSESISNKQPIITYLNWIHGTLRELPDKQILHQRKSTLGSSSSESTASDSKTNTPPQSPSPKSG